MKTKQNDQRNEKNGQNMLSLVIKRHMSKDYRERKYSNKNVWESREGHWWGWMFAYNGYWKRKYKKRNFGSYKTINSLLRQTWCIPSMGTHFLFTKNMWTGDSGVLCHIMNNNNGLFDVTYINDLIQTSSRTMPATKKGKLCIKVWQVDGTKRVHTLWPLKVCPMASANLFFLT